MSADDSFHQLLTRLRAGNRDAEDAAAEVYRRYAQRLIALARTRLSARLLQKTDPEDVVQSVYRSFFARHAEDVFQLGDWDSLWGLLTLITIRKCANRAAFYHARCRDVAREETVSPADEATGMWEVASREPQPDEAVLIEELVERLLRGLKKDAPILALRLEGKSSEEICQLLSRGKRTVQLVLERVRDKLEQEMESARAE
jgi:RNA polymerase sigma-70 factor (ECF subfamily)